MLTDFNSSKTPFRVKIDVNFNASLPMASGIRHQFMGDGVFGARREGLQLFHLSTCSWLMPSGWMDGWIDIISLPKFLFL